MSHEEHIWEMCTFGKFCKLKAGSEKSEKHCYLAVYIMHADEPAFESFAHLAPRPLTLSCDIFSFSLSKSARFLGAERRGCRCVSVQAVEDKCALRAQ